MLLELIPSFFFLSSMGPHTKRASLVPQAARCQKTNRGVDDAYLKERGVNIQRGPSSDDTHALPNVETQYVPGEMRSVPRGKLPSFSPFFFFLPSSDTKADERWRPHEINGRLIENHIEDSPTISRRAKRRHGKHFRTQLTTLM